MKKALFLSILLGCCYIPNAQNMGFSKVYSFNGYTALFLDAMMFNNQIIVSAYITDTVGVNWDVHALLRMNEQGEIQDTIFKRLPQPYYASKKKLIKVNDEILIFPGAFNNNAPILCIYQGDSLLSFKQFNFVNTQAFIIKDIILHSNGSLYVCLNQQDMSYDINTVIIKLNSNYEEEWKLKYGGGSHSEIPNAFTEMPDGSILVGSCKSNLNHTSNFLDPKFYPTWLFRIDTAGQLLNQWTNPDPMSWFPGAMAPTPDGGIVYAGAYTNYHSNGNAMVVNSITKLNNFSNVDWNLKLNSTAGFNFIENLIIHNNYIYACGYEYDSTSVHNGTNEIPLQTQYGVLYKINLNGEIIFKQYYSVPLPLSESTGIHTPIPLLYSISIPNDSTLLMAGEIRVSFSPPQPTLPTQYGWLIKTNLQGCLAPNDCDYIALEEQPHAPLLRVWPNPATEYLSLQVEESWLHSRFSILNLQGQILQRGTLEAPLTILDVQNRPPGLYLLRLTKNGKEHTIKWIKQ